MSSLKVGEKVEEIGSSRVGVIRAEPRPGVYEVVFDDMATAITPIDGSHQPEGATILSKDAIRPVS
jgi:hypothetical protein